MALRLTTERREYRTENPLELAQQLRQRDQEVDNQLRAPVRPMTVQVAGSLTMVRIGYALKVKRGSGLRVPEAGPNTNGQTFGILVTGASGLFTLTGTTNGTLDGSMSVAYSTTGARWFMSDGAGTWWRL